MGLASASEAPLNHSCSSPLSPPEFAVLPLSPCGPLSPPVGLDSHPSIPHVWQVPNGIAHGFGAPATRPGVSEVRVCV